ncbi:MAG: TonB-dependent receptor, partial [Rhodothermales bacterium]
MLRASFLIFCISLFFPSGSLFAQNWGTLEGRIVQAANNQPIPGATVVVNGTNFGTAADAAGNYSMRLPANTYQLVVRALGFTTFIDSVRVVRDISNTFDVELQEDTIEMEGVTVEDEAGFNDAGVYKLDPETIQKIPAPLKDGFRALKVVPGVVTNNELSSQYSVRGGGFNENLIFFNGFEVYMPFRPRQGEQEGLGLFNPELAGRITFYTGGFPARYGGKLSSALEVDYRRPEDEPLQASVSLSLLDATANVSGSALKNKLGWIAGFRKARARYLFSTQELKGNYQPDFQDIQTFVNYRIADGHEIEALGIWADHTFRLDPSNRRTFFGTISQDPRVPSNLQSLWLDFNGEERDGYETRFGGFRIKNRFAPRLTASHDIAYFKTIEEEGFDISGQAVLYLVDPGGNPNNSEDFITTGISRTEDFADNKIEVDTWTAQSRWQYSTRRHAAELGGYFRSLAFNDRIGEKSVVIAQSREGDAVRIVVDSLNGTAQFDETQAGFYIQDAVDVLPEPGRMVVTGGLRTDYFSFNDEWTLSPRLMMRFQPNERMTYTASWGIYHQAPTYRELRGQPDPAVPLINNLNRDLLAQRSMQFVGGVERFLPRSRFYLRGEAYYKKLSNVISYDIENVRVVYTGENDAQAYAYGLDLQLRGEFVPGLESWANYSFLVTNEEFLPDFTDEFKLGNNPRPSDQRHTVSIYVADYIPNDESWKLHMRTLFGSGLPYTPPIEGERIGNIITQVPGERFSARYQRYFRFD